MTEQKEESVTNKDCFVSIDVECAAIGHGHFDKQPCRIAMVDYDGKTLFDMITKVPNIKDSLIEFTGLTIEDIDEKGVPLKHALDKLHELLSKMQSEHENGVTIIGQAPHNDIIWVKLIKGTHYNKMIDLAPMFRTGKYYYSLRKAAYALLQRDMRDDYHDPTEDARVSMQLFREYHNCDSSKINQAKNLLKTMGIQRKFPDFRVKVEFEMCQGMYNPKYCWCGQETARDIFDVDKLNDILLTAKTIPTMTDELALAKAINILNIGFQFTST